MSAGWTGGSTTAWRRLRAQVLQANRLSNAGRCTVRVGALCPRHHRRCEGICTGVATQAHHTRGKRHGDDPRYIVASCAACNGHVGDPATYTPNLARPNPVRWA